MNKTLKKRIKKIILILAIITLCTLDAYHAFGLTTTTFTDGTTTGNLTFTTGSESPTRTIYLSPYSRITNAILYLTGYSPVGFEFHNQTFIPIGNTVTSYHGLWTQIVNVINPTATNDGNIATGTNIQDPAGLNIYILNFTLPTNPTGSIRSGNITIRHSATPGNPNKVAFQCKNKTSSTWINLATLTEINFTGFLQNSIYTLNSYCLNTSDDLLEFKILYDIQGSMNAVIYEIWTNISIDINAQYPTNVSILMNNGSVAYNYGLSNGSILDHKVPANITTSFNYSSTSLWNLSFRSNTSGILEYSGLHIDSYSYLLFYIFNLTTLTPITTNVSYELSNNETFLTGWTTNGTIQLDNYNYSGEYSFQISTPGMRTNIYSIILTPGTYYTENLYLVNTTLSFSMIISDILTGNLIENATITQETLLNGTWQIISSRKTDITGTATFGYTTNTRYRFTITASEYETKTFILDSITSPTYTVKLTRTGGGQSETDWYGIDHNLQPTVYYNNQANNITLLISDPSSNLDQIGITATYPGGTTTNTSALPAGTTLTITAIIINAQTNDQINISYYYIRNGITHNFSTSFYIQNSTYTPGSIMDASTYDFHLGPIDKIIIMIIISIIIGGTFVAIAGEAAGVIMGMLAMGGMAYILHITWYLIIPGFIIAILIVSRRTS